MKNILAIALTFAASTVFAVSLQGDVQLVDAANMTVVDAVGFTAPAVPGGVDIYEVTVTNPNANDVTAIGLDLPNPNADYQNGTTAAVQGSGLPLFGPFTVADSVFNSPVAVGDLLGAGLVQDSSNFIVNYSIAGGGVFVPGNGGSAVVATLVVPAGSTLNIAGFGGNVEFDPSLNLDGERILFIPEPTTALLAGLALVGFVARRK